MATVEKETVSYKLEVVDFNLNKEEDEI